ncbi:MAG: glycerol kinase GlpK [Actinobacteria bacterium]|nr:glycerol kinase GlpK [Actinomycetota bacterium]
MDWVLALDAGTTGVRTLAVGADGRPGPMAYREFPQHFPRPGWVEHDAADILAAALATLGEVAGTLRDGGGRIAAIGITNQRETVVAWDRRTGQPRHRAIVWQDRRTAATCDALREAGHEPLVRARTGLILDPYFSATKMAWLLTEGGVEDDGDLAMGTVDTWLLWNLTGGPAGGVHATEPSNASRTLLYDIGAGAWSPELADRFGVPMGVLPFVGMSSGRFGVSVPDCAAGLAVPVSGIAGDQQASLFGQACVEPGQTKNTYGTGSFVLMNVGSTLPSPVDGLLTTVAWQIGETVTYALEGAVFVTGAAVQWLRDGLGILASSGEAGPLAESVPDTGGVVFVPALTGLGAPYWDPYARGAVLGITRGTTRAHLVRAAIEAMAWQTRDVVDAMTAASGRAIASLRIDGGASVMDLLCRFQADVLGTEVRRSAVRETTALGAAFLAGLAEDVWGDVDDVAAHWYDDGRWQATAPRAEIDAAYAQWRRGVDRAQGWADTEA